MTMDNVSAVEWFGAGIIAFFIWLLMVLSLSYLSLHIGDISLFFMFVILSLTMIKCIANSLHQKLFYGK